MIAYIGDLGSGQQVYIENQEPQTAITLISSSPGQQQSQSSSFQTGTWTKPPALFRSATGFVLQIEGTEGSRFVRLQANGISSFSETPSLSNAEVIPLQQVEKSPQPPMQPMKPMEPMKPIGDMEMRMSPNMEMRMGNMEMRMGSVEEETAATKRFCTECGKVVGEVDRFCTHCGHRLTPS
ncbi:zinc ribbon domain-containing protein [Argonema antarcticum]|uniref:zinc ribbon domain-containing protein n=1 Tax=Argonema antarcticum TaxID=2942763 RepID=UPI0023DEDBEA|nr:zinc ribbon domain-containing protein [Argonema antarcticum]